MYGWENPTFRGYQSLDIYTNKHDDLVIRMQGNNVDMEDQIVVIPKLIAGYVINALRDELLASTSVWKVEDFNFVRNDRESKL